MSLGKTVNILWLLLALFICRVLGQLIVVLYAPTFLPPMDEWYSGILPYSYLLLSQILIIIFFAKIAFDISRKKGFWAKPKRKMGLWFCGFGMLYFAAMIVRLALFGISIPVVFHWVLASFIIVLGLHHTRTE